MKLDYLLACSNPKTIRNRYTHEVLNVPCGKCAGCLMKRNEMVVRVLDRHFAFMHYVYFVTLTYDPRFLPTTSDFPSGVLSKRDIQLFIKRLRKFIGSDEKIFYYCAGEYGPSSLRPHYHLLFGFNSEQLTQNFPKYVYQAWHSDFKGLSTLIGRIDIQSVIGKATNYVASYVNCFSYLPKDLQDKFPPFSLSSHFPQEGISGISYSELYQLIYAPTPKVDFPQFGNRHTSSLAPWQNFENRFFPKCKGFSRILPRYRQLLYTIASRYPSKTASEFCSNFRSVWSQAFDTSVRFTTSRIFFKRFSEFVTYSSVNDFLSQCYVVADAEFVNDDFLVFRALFLDPDSDQLSDDILTSMFYLSNKFLRLCNYFNVSPSVYQWRIEEYYANKDLMLLHSQLEFEQDFLSHYGVDNLFSMFIMIDPLLYNNERKLKNFEFYQKNLYYESLDIELVKRLNASVEKRFQGRFENNCKTKKRNDFLYINPKYSL